MEINVIFYCLVIALAGSAGDMIRRFLIGFEEQGCRAHAGGFAVHTFVIGYIYIVLSIMSS